MEYAVPEESKLAELSAKLPDVGAVLELHEVLLLAAIRLHDSIVQTP